MPRLSQPVAPLVCRLSPAWGRYGAYGAYCLTNFWEHFNGEMETAQGGNLARAAAAAGVQHAIWSTFEDTRKAIPLNDDRDRQVD